MLFLILFLFLSGVSCPLVLHGHDLKLLSIKVDGKELKVVHCNCCIF